jgi:hypothetical protein
MSMNYGGFMQFEDDAFVPSDEQVAQLRDIVRDQDDDILLQEDLERQIEECKARIQARARGIIPEKMAELGIHEIELRDGRKLKLDQIVYGRATDDGIRWLKENGHEDLISMALNAAVARGDEKAIKILRAVLQTMIKAGVKCGIKETVHWKTLEAFLREQIVEREEEIPLALFNGYVGPFAKLTGKKRES